MHPSSRPQVHSILPSSIGSAIDVQVDKPWECLAYYGHAPAAASHCLSGTDSMRLSPSAAGGSVTACGRAILQTCQP